MKNVNFCKERLRSASILKQIFQYPKVTFFDLWSL